NQTITRTIQAGQVASILPQMGNAIPDQSVDGTGKFRKAYKLTSTLPIVAYQFNPLNNSNVFSNDASLLIPKTAYDVDYYGMTFPTLDRRNNVPAGSQPQHHYYGYLTIVAAVDGTQITVTPKVPVVASQIQATLAANVPANFTLNAFDVLQLEASAPA